MAKHPKWPWLTLLVLQGVQFLSLAPWLMMAMMSFMAFDAPGSSEMRGPWLFVITMWSYPLWLLVAGGISWLLFAFRRHAAAVVLSAVFTLPAAAIVLFLVFAGWHGG